MSVQELPLVPFESKMTNASAYYRITSMHHLEKTASGSEYKVIKQKQQFQSQSLSEIRQISNQLRQIRITDNKSFVIINQITVTNNRNLKA